MRVNLKSRHLDTPTAPQLLGLITDLLKTWGLPTDGPASLLLAVGHLSDAPLPWQAGNSAFAGHRDTDFRPLKDIRHGDLIRFATGDSELQYVVRDIEIVEPTDLRVLLPTEQPTLTLITCYPFGYTGAAPQRFVVRAERTSVSGRLVFLPDEQSEEIRNRVRYKSARSEAGSS